MLEGRLCPCGLSLPNGASQNIHGKQTITSANLLLSCVTVIYREKKNSTELIIIMLHRDLVP